MTIKWENGGHTIIKSEKSIRLVPLDLPGPDNAREFAAKAQLDAFFPENAHFVKIHDRGHSILIMNDPKAVPIDNWWAD